MSFDPYGGYSPDRPQDQPPAQPPAGLPPSAPVSPAPPAALARERTIMPGIFLIVVGVLNLLASFGALGTGYAGSQISDEMFETSAKQDPAQAARMKQMKDMGWSYQDLRNAYLYGGVGTGAAILLLSFFTIWGGVCMVRVRGYAMSVLGSLIAAVPCLSPMACPCVLGMVVGIWALVVLLNHDVRVAFGVAVPFQ